MKRRTLLAGSAAAAASTFARSASAQSSGGKTTIVFWHAMTGANNDEINRIARDFNASQNAVELQAIYKGTYPDTLTAAIAAWRAGQAPHVVQVFEVGTGTMLAAGPAVKQVWQLVQETGTPIKPESYIPAVRGYYSLADGRMASMPFNSSTAVMWCNKDAFETAGLDPEKPPATWPELVQAARALRDKWAKPAMDKNPGGPALTASTSSWLTWIQFEEFSAIHNLPYATKADGFEGLDAVLELNGPGQVAQLQRLLDMAKEGTFKYAGRDTAPDPLFYSGQAAVGFGSSAGRGDIVRNAKFKWAPTLLPYDPEIIKAPNNTIIGGASLWTMTAPKRTPEEYKAVAQFLAFIGQPEQDAMYHQHTGYVPVTTAGYELSKQQGYYQKNPGADVAIQSLTRGTITENSKGLRLGRLPEIRNIMYEEIEKALQGQQGAKDALDNTVARGNKVLREFERSART
ncbi:MAG TPA: sn-glycerol-3-phosphate ABC transporter substrate-binding protein UgpB [Acetobacteraceae bacterium]|nr:sn-glycerol-3-phosphate ABC transporter substrate-binding protein UgpB [Acetobacteraceae bacterium]